MVADAPSPTVYTEINDLLDDFAARIQAILGNQFVGLYVYGSLALGDFDPRRSDIDLVIVSQGRLPEGLDENLGEMHAGFDRRGSVWSNRVEAAYIPIKALNQKTPTGETYPQVERGTALFRAPLEAGWAFQRHVLREQGITVAGPGLRAWIDPVAAGEMREAVQAITRGWLQQSREDPGWLAWVRQREALSFVVLTLCRMLYSLETGSVASKPAAARRTQERLGERWEELIRRALEGQQDKGDVDPGEVEEMLALLAYIEEQSR